MEQPRPTDREQELARTDRLREEEEMRGASPGHTETERDDDRDEEGEDDDRAA